jgi:hypothetical protein
MSLSFLVLPLSGQRHSLRSRPFPRRRRAGNNDLILPEKAHNDLMLNETQPQPVKLFNDRNKFKKLNKGDIIRMACLPA